MSVTTGERPGREALAQASLWLARLRADDCSIDDRQGFAAWLAEGEANRKAFEHVTLVFESVGAAAGDWPRTLPEEPALSEPEPGPEPRSRRGFLLGAGALAAGAGTLGWQAAFAGTVETGFGERRTLVLDDGSSVTLDAQTRIREPWLRERRIDLSRGRVYLQARPGQQPFSVAAEAHMVRGRAMDVDLMLDRGTLTIAVVSGEVSVERAGQGEVRLRSGQRLLPNGAIDVPSMAALTAWRQGQLVFIDTPLGEACAQLNRYDRLRLSPAKEVAGIRISGTYAIGRNSAFAHSIEQLLPVRVEASGDALLLRRARIE